jgi:hypothetical protein
MPVNATRLLRETPLAQLFADLLGARPDVFAPGQPALQRAGE